MVEITKNINVIHSILYYTPVWYSIVYPILQYGIVYYGISISLLSSVCLQMKQRLKLCK